MAGSAENMMQELMNEYNSKLKGANEYKNEMFKSFELNIDFTKNMDKLQDTFKIFEDQEKILNRIHLKEIAHQKQVNEWMIKNKVYQDKASQDYAKNRLEDAKRLYKLQNDNDSKYYEQLNKEEAKIYEAAVKNNRKLTNDELKAIEDIEKRRLQSEENIQKQKEEKLKKWEDAGKKIAKELMSFAADMFNIYLLNNVKASMTEMQSAYEQNFTTIAGYTGSNSRQGNHDFIKGVLTEVNAHDYTKGGLNFNTEVMPELVNVVKQGFTGEEATEIAISNAIDKKIMPWLETSSETWVQLQYNLTDERIQQIKGQQLLLQETREGNRILQSGVADALLNELSPTLLNIEANTTDVSKLSADAQASVAYLMQSGYSQSDAIKITNQAIDAYQNPYNALTSNTPVDILMGITSHSGGDLSDILTTYGRTGSMGIGTGSIGMGAVQQVMGVNYGGFTRTDDNAIDLAQLGGEDFNKIRDKFLTSPEEAKEIYLNKQLNLTENTTATQEYDNNMKNAVSGALFDFNNTVHGMDVITNIYDKLSTLTNWFIGTWAADKVGNLLGKGLKNVGGNFNGETNSLNALSRMKVNASAAGDMVQLNTGNATLGKLATFNSSLGGIALNTGTALAGGMIANKGINDWQKDNKIINSAMSTDEEIKNAKDWKNKTSEVAMIGGGSVAALAGGTAAAAGIASAAGVGSAGLAAVGAAAGPVGWIALAVAGVGLLGKAAYDHATRLSGLAEQYQIQGENLKAAFKEEQQQRIENAAFLKQNIEDAQTNIDAQNEIINSGLLSENTARNLTVEQLSNLTSTIISTEASIAALGDAAIDAKTKVAKEEAQQQTNDVLNDTYKNIKGLLGRDNVVKEGDEEYTQIKAMFEGMASSIEDEEERKLMQEQLNTMFKEGEFDKAELDILMNKNTWDANTRAALHTSMDRKRNFYDYNMNVESANAYLGVIEGNGSYDLKEVTIDQNTAAWQASLDKWYSTYTSTDDNATKEAAKNSFLDIWNTNIKSNKEYYDYLKPKYQSKASIMGIKEFKLGSSYIPNDMIAMVHKGERVLTENQNKDYTEQLISGENKNIIQLGVQDIVNAISQQTRDIIHYLNELSLNNSMSHDVNMSPAMGNTRVVI